jgi:outer membrane lipoprotein carrier protein
MRRFVVSAILTLTPIVGSAQSPSAVLDRAVAAYAKVRTAKASFVQTINNPLMQSSVTSSGEVVQRRPSYVSVRFSDPAGDRIVADGRWVWLYLPSTNPGQVIRQSLGRNSAGTPDILGELLDSVSARYRIADGGIARIAGRPTHAVALTAREADAPFRKVTVWVDDEDGYVRQFETTDQSGLTRRVTITKLTINPQLDRSAFIFSPPKGVKVMDASSL